MNMQHPVITLKEEFVWFVWYNHLHFILSCTVVVRPTGTAINPSAM